MSNARTARRSLAKKRQPKRPALPVGAAARTTSNDTLRVYAMPSDNWACGAYRVQWPAEAVHQQTDMQVTVITPEMRKQQSVLKAKIVKDSGGRQAIGSLTFFEDADLFVIQRPTNRWLAEAVSALRYAGVTVVVDIDDDLARVHPNNPAYHHLHPRRINPENAWKHAEQACRDASLVTVSTPQLAERYGSHGRVQVLPNYLPERALAIPHTDSDLLTWCGAISSHPNDLQTVGAAVANLVRQGTRFKVIGVGQDTGRPLGLETDPSETGQIPLDGWYEAVAASGVTIAPLADTDFNAAKSWLKMLEAMGTGVPIVASDRVEYRRLHNLTGCGTLVRKPNQWEAALRRLLSSEALRREHSETGRAAVKDGFTLEANAWRWAEAWTRARQIDLAMQQRGGGTWTIPKKRPRPKATTTPTK